MSADKIPPKIELPLRSEWIVGYCVREALEKIPEDYSIEVEAALSYEFAGFVLSGHIDCVSVSPDETEAIGFDWKTGYAATDPAENNEQVLGYCVLLKRAYPNLKKITFHIVQPRNDEDLGFQRVSSVILEWSGVDFITRNFERRINEALANPRQLETGKQCRFCPAQMQCPAILKEIEEMKLTLTDEMLAKITAEPDDAILGDIVCSAKTLDAPIDQARELIKARIAAKGFITAGNGRNLSLKTTKGSYEVLEPDAFQASLLSVIPADRLPYCTTPSIGDIKKEIAKAQGCPQTGKAPITSETLFNAKLRPFVKQGIRQEIVIS